MQSLLLDTHALVWWLAEPERLSAVAYAAIADDSTRVFVSAASGWEIATKVRLGKLPHRDPFDRLLAAQAELDQLTLVSQPPRTAGVG